MSGPEPMLVVAQYVLLEEVVHNVTVNNVLQNLA